MRRNLRLPFKTCCLGSTDSGSAMGAAGLNLDVLIRQVSRQRLSTLHAALSSQQIEIGQPAWAHS